MQLNAFSGNVSLSTKRTESDVISYCGTIVCVWLEQHILTVGALVSLKPSTQAGSPV